MNVTKGTEIYYTYVNPNAKHIIIFDNHRKLNDVISAFESLPYADIFFKVFLRKRIVLIE